ncbi:hypothetical protein KIN20_001785 [Parelaphostrongylus tenuis]|uniref:Uncharacterized protein n=1 Tax=Parelaphostrongylus tenuis TaxID=148309 RepID=A0AAD5MDA9_PARTN|nr:hypothetical protein KIN20_001785 [Parelaphostrongylus tenuis]
MSLSPHYDNHIDLNASASNQPNAEATLHPITHKTGRFIGSRADSASNLRIGHGTVGRSILTDPPKINQLYMSITYRQDIEDTQWASSNTMSKHDSALNVGGVDWLTYMGTSAAGAIYQQ